MPDNNALLNRLKQSDPQLASLADDGDVNLEATESTAAWWPGVTVVDVTVDLPHKPLRFRYALDDHRMVKLGMAAGVRQVNAMTRLQLSEPMVGAYLRFFIASSEYRSVQVVEFADEPSWLEDADTDPETAARKQAAQALIHPISVTPGPGAFRAVLTGLQGRDLVSMVFDVARDGTATLVSSAVLMEGLPVPYQGL